MFYFNHIKELVLRVTLGRNNPIRILQINHKANLCGTDQLALTPILKAQKRSQLQCRQVQK